jgi:hypothetical protein
MKFSLKIKYVFVFILTFLILQVRAQIPVGSWRDHLPYGSCKKVVQIGTKLFVATPYNIFTYDTRDNSFQKLSRINGVLSDMGISTMDYYPNKSTLLITYDNGNIDLLKNFQVTNIPIIKKRIMPGSKKANHILFRGDFAYISYSFGIVVLDLGKLEVKDTYLVGETGVTYEVLSLACDDQNFYAATTNGIFKADINNPYLVNYAEWHRDITIPNNTGKFNILSYFNNKLFANYSGTKDTLYYLDNSVWKKILVGQNQQKFELRSSGNKLLITGFNILFVLNSNLEVTTTIPDYGFIYPRPRSALADDEGNIWIADDQVGLVFNQSATSNFKSYYPNGPKSQNVWNMLYQNGTIYVTGGGADGVWSHLYTHGQYYMFNNESWTSIYNDNIWDFTAIAVDPSNANKVYVGTEGNGVLVYENGQVTKNYTYNNSTLQSIVPNDNYVHIGGLIFDKDHNLWVTNGGDGLVAPISVLKPEGEWKKFSFGTDLSVKVISQIYIDTYGQFWLVLPHGDGLFVFDINGTLDNLKDDRSIRFKPKTIPPYNEIVSNINCVTGDRDGNIWVGTDHGPILYSDPKHVLDSLTDGTEISIPRNDGTNSADLLLHNENVTCIAIDGGNRKWFGTEKGGAFLISPDGLKEIAHFNTDNSPIFSNYIRSIAINDKTGEVFFGTDKGIIGYRGNSTEPNEDFTNVYVFPNPVRENYHGDIVITGLIANTHVKITDISGNLVYQTKSVGGQAVWDGKTGGGRRVATGVYLVFCSNDDGSKTIVTKILVIH